MDAIGPPQADPSPGVSRKALLLAFENAGFWRPLLALPYLGRLRILTHPFVALPLWAVSLYLWHPLRHLLIRHHKLKRPLLCLRATLFR